MSFKAHKEKSDALPSATDEQLKKETEKRFSNNIFPLGVFNEKLKPLIDILATKVDTPRSYIGLALLSSYSSAIGTAYVVRNAIGDVCLCTWACFTGISSSGKSTAINIGYSPLTEIQRDFRMQRSNAFFENEEEKSNTKLKYVLFKDVLVPTLVRTLMPDNPKGVTKQTDEILEWINGLNAYSKKESTDEQFYLSAWNNIPHSGLRGDKSEFSIEKTFCNIYGGIQPSALKELFKNNRGKTGFVFRILFTSPYDSKVSDPITDYEIPNEFKECHREAIRRLYFDKPVHSHYDKPDIILISPAANTIWNQWYKAKIFSINKMEDVMEREISSSIYGKIKEYILRFAGILHLMDKALDPTSVLLPIEEISEDTMKRAVLLGNYFFQTAEETYRFVNADKTVPPEVLQMVFYTRRGKSFSDIGELMYGSKTEATKSKARRNYNKWIVEYPKQFNSER
jgi:hypothetical protein